MAIPTFVAAGTIASGTGAVSPGLPVGWAANDILILLVQSGTDAAAALPSGWTSIASVTNFGGGSELAAWLRADISTTAPTVADSGDHTTAVILAIRGCISSGSPINTTVGTGSSTGTSVAYAAVSTTVADCLVFAAGFHSLDTTGAQVSGYTHAGLSSFTELFDDSSSSGTGGGIFAAAGGRAVAGATGTGSATLATSGGWTTATFGLTPSNSIPITVNNAANANASTSPTLAAKSVVVVGNAANANTATSPTLASSVITPANAANGHAATSPTLATKNTITVNAAAQAHSGTSPTIAAKSSFTVSAASHGHLATSPALAAIIPAIAPSSRIAAGIGSTLASRTAAGIGSTLVSRTA